MNIEESIDQRRLDAPYAERLAALRRQREHLRVALECIAIEPCEDDNWRALALRLQATARDAIGGLEYAVPSSGEQS